VTVVKVLPILLMLLVCNSELLLLEVLVHTLKHLPSVDVQRLEELQELVLLLVQKLMLLLVQVQKHLLSVDVHKLEVLERKKLEVVVHTLKDLLSVDVHRL
jgi:hypothetical protein